MLLPIGHDFARGGREAMNVTRIVANLSAPDPTALATFYQKMFGLTLSLDMGWIAFLTNGSAQKTELHTASQCGSDTDLPVISIGVDDLDATEDSVRAAEAEIVYGPVEEEWGLRRFYFRDIAGSRCLVPGLDGAGLM